jgi:hypothetical protein
LTNTRTPIAIALLSMLRPTSKIVAIGRDIDTQHLDQLFDSCLTENERGEGWQPAAPFVRVPEDEPCRRPPVAGILRSLSNGTGAVIHPGRIRAAPPFHPFDQGLRMARVKSLMAAGVSLGFARRDTTREGGALCRCLMFCGRCCGSSCS